MDRSPETWRALMKMFVKHLFSGVNKERILYVWGRFLPDDAEGSVDALAGVIAPVCDDPIDFAIQPSYIQLFEGNMSLRIPREILDRKCSCVLDFLEKEQDEEMFFTKSRMSMFECGGEKPYASLLGFNYNDALEEGFNRRALVLEILYKTIMLGLDRREGSGDCYAICLCALKRVLAKRVYGQPPSDKRTSLACFLLEIITRLREKNTVAFFQQRRNEYAFAVAKR